MGHKDPAQAPVLCTADVSVSLSAGQGWAAQVLIALQELRLWQDKWGYWGCASDNSDAGKDVSVEFHCLEQILSWYEHEDFPLTWILYFAVQFFHPFYCLHVTALQGCWDFIFLCKTNGFCWAQVMGSPSEGWIPTLGWPTLVTVCLGIPWYEDLWIASLSHGWSGRWTKLKLVSCFHPSGIVTEKGLRMEVPPVLQHHILKVALELPANKFAWFRVQVGDWCKFFSLVSCPHIFLSAIG